MKIESKIHILLSGLVTLNGKCVIFILKYQFF